jgi:HEAT repeat protein
MPGDNRVTNRLAERLRDEDIDVYIDAAEAPGRLGVPDTISTLIESMYKDPDGEVTVVENLGQIGCQTGCSEVIDPLLDISTIQHFGSFKKLPVEQIAELLTDDNTVVRKSVLAALSTRAESPDEEILSIVISAVEDPNPGVAIAACDILAGIQNESIQHLLLNVLAEQERQPEVRAQAAHCLGKSGIWNADSSTYMGKTVIDDIAEVRLSTLDALLELANINTAETQRYAEHKEIKSPLQIILSALDGNIKLPASKKVIPIILVETISLIH